MNKDKDIIKRNKKFGFYKINQKNKNHTDFFNKRNKSK